jgi:hypothetical protein
MEGRIFSKKITYGGIITAINIILLYLASIVPTAKITLFTLVSISVAIMIIEFKVREAIITYLSTSIIGLLIVPSKSIMILYVAFFGYYGIIKYYIERINNVLIEWVLKIIFFNIVFSIVFKIVKELLFGDITLKYSILFVLFAAEVGFIAFDYAFSLVVNFYNNKLKNNI